MDHPQWECMVNPVPRSWVNPLSGVHPLVPVLFLGNRYQLRDGRQ